MSWSWPRVYLLSANTHLLWVMINARLLPDTYRTGPDTFTLCICIDLGGTPLHSHAWTSPKFPLTALGILKGKRIIRETQYFFFGPDREETLYIFTTHVFSLTTVVELELAELIQCNYDFKWHLYFINKYLVWSRFSLSK